MSEKIAERFRLTRCDNERNPSEADRRVLRQHQRGGGGLQPYGQDRVSSREGKRARVTNTPRARRRPTLVIRIDRPTEPVIATV